MKIEATTLDAYNLLHKGVLAFNRAERQGMRIDTDYCKKMVKTLNKRISKRQKKLKKTKLYKLWEKIYKNKVNTDSNYQLEKVLYGAMKIKPPAMTKKGDKGATDEETLSQINVKGLKTILKIRKLRKLRDTYIKGFMREQVDGYLHPFFNLHTVRTYRSSSDKINFQNIPKRDNESQRICRRAIYPRPGHQLLEFDYSGIEVRIAACFTEDEKLIYDVLHGDMHGDMAVELYQLDRLDKSHPGEYTLRQGGKNGFVFPEFYGDYYGNCAAALLKWAEDATLKDGTPALEHLNNKKLITLDSKGRVKNANKFMKHVEKVEDRFWNERYKTYTKWKESTWKKYQRKGYVDMPTGFRVTGVMSKNETLNTPIQGTAFHCLLWSFIEIDKAIRKRKMDTKLIGQIHDAGVSDTHPDEIPPFTKMIRKIMCDDIRDEWKWIIVPLEIEADVSPVDGNWYDQSEYKIQGGSK